MTASAIIPGLHFHLDQGQCVGCAICADVCADGALRLDAAALRPEWFAARCSGCRLCEQECPTGAIAVRFSRAVGA